jgi:hypothetical protein
MATAMSYPYPPGVFRITEALVIATHLLTAFGPLALIRSGLLGDGRLARAGSAVAVLGMVLIVPSELGFALFPNAETQSTTGIVLGAAMGLSVLIAGLGFVLAGVAVLRARRWHGYGRWTTLLVGAAAVHLIGAGLLTVTTVFGLTVRADLFGRPIPDWYLPIQRWLDGLDTTALGLLWPLAQLLFGLVVIRTRAVPVWAGWVLVVAGVGVLAQLVAFGGVIPAPMFIAWVVLGVAALAGAREARRPAREVAS